MSKIKACPMFNYCFLTCNKMEKSKGGIILTASQDVILPRQTILKCGATVRILEPGMDVEIDPRPYFVKDWKKQDSPDLNEELHKQTVSIAWPIEEIDGVEVMVVPDNHVRMYWPKEDVVTSQFEV